MLQLEAIDRADHNFLNSTHSRHLTKWHNSSVDDRLTSLNVLSLSGTEPNNHLFYFLPSSERRNNGQIRNKWLDRYFYTQAGGYWIPDLASFLFIQGKHHFIGLIALNGAYTWRKIDELLKDVILLLTAKEIGGEG